MNLFYRLDTAAARRACTVLGVGAVCSSAVEESAEAIVLQFRHAKSRDSTAQKVACAAVSFRSRRSPPRPSSRATDDPSGDVKPIGARTGP